MSIFSQLSRFFGKAPTGHGFVRGRGFTLVELLTVFAVITILTTVFLLQQRRFDSSTLLRSLGYSISLSIRQAQVYGSSVRQFGASSTGFNYNYGVYFSGSGLSCANGNNTCYVLFADVNDNNLYTSSPTDEKVQQFDLHNGYSITKFCATVATGGVLGSSHCSTGASPIHSLTVYFERPNPDALFSTDIGSETYSSAYIQIVGPNGGADTRSITVTSTGQISVGAFGS